MDKKQLLWSLFKLTGKIEYYMEYKNMEVNHGEGNRSRKDI